MRELLKKEAEEAVKELLELPIIKETLYNLIRIREYFEEGNGVVIMSKNQYDLIKKEEINV